METINDGTREFHVEFHGPDGSNDLCFPVDLFTWLSRIHDGSSQIDDIGTVNG